MADYVGCSNQYLDLMTVLASCFSLNANGDIVFRIDEEATGEESPLECSTDEDVKDLIRRAISLADDGLPALRVIITDVANGVGLDLVECSQHQNFWELLKRSFYETDQGEVAINIVNIT